jgi:hypothetical protein
MVRAIVSAGRCETMRAGIGQADRPVSFIPLPSMFDGERRYGDRRDVGSAIAPAKRGSDESRSRPISRSTAITPSLPTRNSAPYGFVPTVVSTSQRMCHFCLDRRILREEDGGATNLAAD